MIEFKHRNTQYCNYLTFFVLLVVFLSVINVNAQEVWKGLIPLVTTREEVEIKLGKPNLNGFYELEEGRVKIGYVNAKCEKIIRCDCLVAAETVHFIRIEIYYDLSIKDINLKHFKKTQDSHIPAVFSYSNSKTGIVYDVQDEIITHINYYESEKNCNEILQNNSKRKSPKSLCKKSV